MLNLPAPDYEAPYEGTPGMGDFVEFDHAGALTAGVVVDMLIAHRGPLLVVRAYDGRTIDIHWQRVVLGGMPDNWPNANVADTEDAKAFIERQQDTCFDLLDDRR
jgi:hypothetical protein